MNMKRNTLLRWCQMDFFFIIFALLS